MGMVRKSVEHKYLNIFPEYLFLRLWRNFCNLKITRIRKV
jgi:hypothetical protein